MKNVRDGVRHALRHGVVSLKSSFFVGLIIIGRLNNTIILLISLIIKISKIFISIDTSLHIRSNMNMQSIID
jgi:hypothetical protein